MSKRSTFFLFIPARFLVVAALVLMAGLYAPGVYSNDPSLESPAPRNSLNARLLTGTVELQLIVQLTGPSLVEWIQAGGDQGKTTQLESWKASSRMDLRSSKALAYQGQIEATQHFLAERLVAIDGVEIEGSLSTVLNALMVRTPSEQYDRVCQLPGVKKVYLSRLQRRLLNTSADLVNATGLWNRAGGNSTAGMGVKIGIIDTGIDITNPMFIDNSLSAPSGYPKGESAYTNRKVIVARNYMHLLSRNQSIRSAIDEVGHGTFVAGIAAGKQVAAPLATISGMAPGAFLGNYKVFGTPGINDYTTTTAVLAAIEAAVTDGMDIINMSLGSLDYSLPSEDPEIAALDNAVQAGVLAVVSAGNDGPGMQTIASPGIAANALTVGSVSNSRIFASQLHVTAPIPVPAALIDIAYLSGSGPQISSNIASTAVVDVETLDGNGFGCSAFPSGSLKGKIALIERGGLTTSCSFAVKIGNASTAGASAAIVYNHIANDGIFSMGGLDNTRLPAVMISHQDGIALKNQIALYPGSTLVAIDNSQTLNATPTVSRIVSSFSAVGPTSDFSIKPDLVAVGENVYSAAQSISSSGDMYDADKFTVSQGTSFSSPMVAGAAAGLKQLFPELSALELKSLLTSTASRQVTSDGVTTASIFHAGAGLLDMGSAATAGAVCSPSHLNFGAQSYSDHITLTRTFSIKNLSTSTDQYTVSIEPLVPGPRFYPDREISEPIAPAATADITITLQIDAPLSGGFQGFVLIRSSASTSTYRIPYWAGLYVADSSRVLTVSQSTTGTDHFRSIAAALQAAQPGNIIEIADSNTYPAPLMIGLNQQGLPLHGLTIRAAAGETPAIDGSGLSDQANITIMGLRHVLLQGIKIYGGSTGILLQHSTPVSPLSVTIDQCTITDTNEGSSSVGIEIDGGGSLEITHSVIANSDGVGILVDEGTYFTLSDSTVKANGDVGIEASNSNIQILNSTVTNNTGPGLYATSCWGTLSGSNFSSNYGTYGDGAEIIDGNFTIAESIFESNDRLGLLFSSARSTGAGPVINLSRTIFQSNKAYALVGNPVQNLQMDGNMVKDNARGIRFSGSSAALLRNNIVARSTDTQAGNGIEIAGTSKVRIVNNTIYRNGLQGVVLSSGASLSILNSIISSNRSGDIQGLSSNAIDFSLVGDRNLGGNNLSGDPMLTNPDADIFDLASGSPALNAGSNEAADLPFLDFHQRLRIAASSSSGISGDSNRRVDMGATEADSTYSLIFPLVANGLQSSLGDNYTTGLALLNIGSATTEANLAAYNSSGSILEGSTNPAIQTILPGAQLPTLAPQLFGFDYSQPNLGGALVSSWQRLAGFFLLFDSEFSRFAEGINVSAETATDLIFMHHPSNSDGKTTFCLFNPGTTSASIKATLLGTTGSALAAAKTATVAAKGQYVFEFDPSSSVGYVRIQSDRPISGMELSGNNKDLSLLGAVSPGSEARLFFPHIAFNQGFTTSLGIINSNSTKMEILLTAYTDEGEILGTPTTVTLQANGHLLQSVSELFSLAERSQLTTGYVVAECDRNGALGFTTFRYDGTVQQSSAAVPADSLPQKHLLFSHVAHQTPSGSGINYQTGIALLNPTGTSVPYTLKVYDSTGRLLAEKSDSLSPRQKVAKILSHPSAEVGFFTQAIALAGGHVEVWTDYGLFGFELFFTEDFSQLASVPAQH